MAKSSETFSKKEKEKKRRKKKQDKLEKREQRKLEKAERGKLSFEDQISYVDEYGNITDTPPDPAKKLKVKAEDIVLGVPPKTEEDIDEPKKGIVKFFSEEKGFGFINDLMTKERLFVHISDLNEPIVEDNKVTFEVKRGPKGLVAYNVSIDKS